MPRLAELTLRISDSDSLKMRLTLLTLVVLVLPSAALMSMGYNPHWVLPLTALLVMPLQYVFALLLGASTRFIFELVIKRSLDILYAVCVLWLVLPICTLIALLVRATAGEPPIIVRERFDLSGQRLRLFIFRTTNSQGATTPVGWFLRKTALDQLPLLLNVLRGDLSVVGPMPLLRADESEAYRGLAPVRFRCGMAGFAQLQRDRNPESTRACNIQYISKWSLRRDVAIVGSTMKLVLGGESDKLTHMPLAHKPRNPVKALAFSTATGVAVWGFALRLLFH